MTVRPLARWVAVLAAAGVFAGCAPAPDVVTERADTIGRSGPTAGPGSDDAGNTDGVPAPATTLAWASCAEFGAPDPAVLGTSGWECAELDVPMDPFGSSAGLEPVTLALTRHRATGERRGALLVNPGGPGASGLQVSWSLRGSFPAEVLRAFDIVSWDPRGVGRSTPPIRCGAGADPGADDLMEGCAAATGDLAAHLSAPYSSADMEAIRVALGETRLDFLGYSYGTLLGAQYAARYPDRVGRFVLDGAVDPRTGASDGVFEQGFPYYSVDGAADAADRFEELCDATPRCDLGDDSEAAIIDLRGAVADLPTPFTDRGPDVVTGDMFADVMRAAFAFSGDWELVATALADGRQGDASALAVLVEFGPDAGGGDSDDGADDGQGFEFANLVIYCADFGPLIVEWSYCDPIPRNAEPLRPVAEVDVDTPMLVIGTTFDPATPGRNAPEFAAALGDAVHVIWDGVGHTAFPTPTECVNDLVSAYLFTSTLPSDATSCPFYDGVDGDAELADLLFGHGDAKSLRLLEQALEFGVGATRTTARCAAPELNGLADQVISHVVLGVQSPIAVDALNDALGPC